jgi:hypothetical protein
MKDYINKLKVKKLKIILSEINSENPQEKRAEEDSQCMFLTMPSKHKICSGL